MTQSLLRLFEIIGIKRSHKESKEQNSEELQFSIDSASCIYQKAERPLA